jgi:hypothetical protein
MKVVRGYWEREGGRTRVNYIAPSNRYEGIMFGWLIDRFELEGWYEKWNCIYNMPDGTTQRGTERVIRTTSWEPAYRKVASIKKALGGFDGKDVRGELITPEEQARLESITTEYLPPHDRDEW